MSIVVVGSVALDTVETPAGKVVEALGGSATYFSLAARHYAPVSRRGRRRYRLPAPTHRDPALARRSGSMACSVEPGRDLPLERALQLRTSTTARRSTPSSTSSARSGRSFPESYQNEDVVFLANIDPDLQLDVLRQVRKPWLTAMDTMNFWISVQARTGRRGDALGRRRADQRGRAAAVHRRSTT